MILSRSLLLIRRVARSLTARVLLGAVLALGTATLAPLFETFIPDAWQSRFGAEAVMPILTILATTMLTVTTFSLSVMVQAFQTAASQATPRAYRIHLSDSTTQTVLATFTGAFLFAFTAIMMFRAGFYSDSAAVVIFGVTLLVVAAIILAILRWIDHLSSLGSMDDTLAKVERQARAPLRLTAEPALGGLPLPQDAAMPETARPLPAPRGGYVQFIDMAALHATLHRHDLRLSLVVMPGHHVVRGAPLGWLPESDADLSELTGAVTIGDIRTAEQDARYGITVLNEVAVRALSPGINDPGTAIDVIHRLTRLLSETEAPGTEPPKYPRIEMPPLRASDLVEDGFAPLIRAGAAHPEVLGQAVTALEQLEQTGWADLSKAARAMRGYALRHGKLALDLRDDRDTVARH